MTTTFSLHQDHNTLPPTLQGGKSSKIISASRSRNNQDGQMWYQYNGRERCKGGAD